MKLYPYSKEELVDALIKIQEKYPTVYKHFFLAELDPEQYQQYMFNLGRLENKDGD